jgi:integrase/recombinase XerD
LIPEDFSPHKIRHSTAMGLVDSGVDLIYIRDLLGHVSVKTTEVYAKTSAQLKRKAIEAHASKIVQEEVPEWEFDSDLKSWLKDLGKRKS